VRITGRATRVTLQITLLLAMLSTGLFVMLRPYLTDDERLFDNGRITEVYEQGPATIGGVEWKLDSLQAYTILVDDEGESQDLGKPPGSVIMMATLTVTAGDQVRIKDGGFSCSAVLTDDRGNTWNNQGVFGLKVPTSCTDDENPFKAGKPATIAQVYVVPASAVPHLTGVLLENLDERRRILIEP
jgi:hypothetical protein